MYFLDTMDLLTKYIKYRRKYYYFVILISLGLVKCDTCENNYKLTQEGRHFCYHNQSTINECEILSENDIQIHPADENGTADVKFNFNPNCCYNLTLSYLENNEDCVSHRRIHIDHSFYSFKGIYEPNIDTIPDKQHCTQRGKIQLKHLYTGCYKIQINHMRRFKLQKFTVKSKKVDFDSSHPNSFKIDYKFPANSPKVNAVLTIVHPFFNLLPTVELSISSVNSTEITDNIFTEKILPNTTNTLVNTKHLVEYNIHNKNTSIRIDCNLKEYYFRCNIKGLNPGTYRFTYLLENIIQCPNYCYKCSVWSDCFREGDKRDTEIDRPKARTLTSTDAPENSKNILPWIIVTVILSILIILTAGILYSRRKICKRNVKFIKSVVEIELGSKDTESLMVNDKKIFLLYPRDEINVMQVIQNFRMALSDEGFQVFDIFDDEKESEININPTEWINEIFDCKTMKIILIRTYCWNYFKFPDAYRKPDNRDEHFLYAKNRINQNYNTLNILTVDIGMRTNYTNPVNSAVIYDLPDNIEKLLKVLHNNPDYSIDEKNNNVWNEFKNKITELQRNVSSNKYLINLFNVRLPLSDKNCESI